MLGIGIDAVDIDRFRRALDRTPNFRTRVFTTNELDGLSGKNDDAPSLAARFAAREATMKVLGVGLGAFDMHDVSIERQASGQPTLLHLRAQRTNLLRRPQVQLLHTAVHRAHKHWPSLQPTLHLVQIRLPTHAHCVPMHSS